MPSTTTTNNTAMSTATDTAPSPSLRRPAARRRPASTDNTTAMPAPPTRYFVNSFTYEQVWGEQVGGAFPTRHQALAAARAAVADSQGVAQIIKFRGWNSRIWGHVFYAGQGRRTSVSRA